MQHAQSGGMMRKMGTNRTIVRVILLAALFCLLLIRPVGADELGQPTDQASRSTPVAESTQPGPVPVHLYFGSPNGSYLISETRIMSTTEDPVQLARSILEALISGPRSELTRTVPAASRLRAIFVTTDNICIADFSSDIREQHPGGCGGEMLTVYSIVNSLIMNIPSIKQVKLLIEGNDIESVAGHMSLQNPIPANMLIIR